MTVNIYVKAVSVMIMCALKTEKKSNVKIVILFVEMFCARNCMILDNVTKCLSVKHAIS